MFKVTIGDLFDSNAQTLVNTVNSVGVMGKGVALEFKQRFPALFEDYKARCDRRQVRLGEPYLFVAPTGKLILNFPTKDHWRSPSRLADIERGLDFFIQHFREWGITSIAFPPLGCGNGGLDWTQVGPLLYYKLNNLPIDVEIYAPYGTSKTELSEEFLAAPAQLTFDEKGRKLEKFNSEWIPLVEVLRELGLQPYANPVGRTIFQKICYVLTEMGLNTGFEFGKGSYGPFADEVKLALHEFANRNWVHEQPLGKMVALRVGGQYEKDRNKFIAVIQQHQKKIHKAVDLFSRIKNTEQAEEVFTVLFASRQLKREHSNPKVTEQEMFDYILEWKKAWSSDSKRLAVAAAIRNLVMLGWLKLNYSATIPNLDESTDPAPSA